MLQRAPRRLGALVAQLVLGRRFPPLHGESQRAGVEIGQTRDQGTFVLGEQIRRPVGHVGEDGLDLAARQLAVVPGLRGGRQLAQRARRAGQAHRGLVGQAVPAQPRGRRRRTVGVVELGGVEGTNGLGDLGVEAVPQGQRRRDGVTRDRHFQLFDCDFQRTQHLRQRYSGAVTIPGPKPLWTKDYLRNFRHVG